MHDIPYPYNEDESDVENWIVWECPDCEEEHLDPIYIKTHCRKCGLVVIAIDGQGISQDEHIVNLEDEV